MNSRLLAGCVCLLLAFGPVVIANQPPLSITNAGGNIIVSWPVTGDSWALEGSPALSVASAWSAVVPTWDETNGAIRRVAVASGDTNRFFRLRRLGSGVPGLTGRWQLDEGTGQVAHDGSGAGATLFIEGASWTSGRIGPGSLHFNGIAGAGGSRCWVSNSNSQVLPGAGQPFSVSFWISPDTLTTGIRGLAGTDANGSNGWHVALSTIGPGTNYLVFAGSGAGASLSVTGRTLLLPRQWYHVTVTSDGSLGSLYLDGIRLASGTGTVPAHKGPVYFGGGIGGYSSFLGRIDDVRTFTNCLTDEKVSLNGEWLFDEGLGAFAEDSSGGEHHGTLSNSAARLPGRLGGGVDLSSCQIAIPNNDLTVLPPSGKPFSISFWLRPALVTPGRFGLLHHGLDGVNGWQMDVVIGESGQANLHLSSTNSGGTLDLTAPVLFAVGVWTKLDVTYNGGIATVYSNGRKVRAGSGAIRASRASIVIGSVPGLPNFRGVVDELRIHGREKGESEVGPVAPVMWETVLMNTVTNFLLRGSGPSGRPLAYAIVPVIVPTNGTVTINPGSSVATYVAGARKGPDAFTYTVSDGEFTSAPSIVRVSVVEPHWLAQNGGSEATLDGRSPSRAWRTGTARVLEWIWKTNNYYDCFFYGPGTYETKGFKYYERSTANPGCKHVGSGSFGDTKTTLKLVDAVGGWTEGFIFAPLHYNEVVDDFEIHDMLLDCNAGGVPSYVVGEPIWIDIPLAEPAYVDSVTLRWANSPVPEVPLAVAGRAAAFSFCAVTREGETNSTNCTSHASTGSMDTISVGAYVASLSVQLERRASGVHFYGLTEIDVEGATPSLASARILGSITESRLGSSYSILMAVDDDQGTAWASGAETNVQIELPLAPGTRIGQVNLHWNCRLVPGLGHLGPATTFSIRARDEVSGVYFDVPFVRRERDASNLEAAVFGTAQTPASVTTDRLVILLTARQPESDYYSVREITLQDGLYPVKVRLPTAFSSAGSGYSILRAFDVDPTTIWASGSQGMVGAIYAPGNNLKFKNLQIVGFGTKAGREGFPMVASPIYGPTAVYGNILIESCTFRLPANNNSDGTTVISMNGSSRNAITNAAVRKCTVEGLARYFLYSQAMSATRVEECRVVDCSRAVYFEPDASNVDTVGHVTVRSNQFINVDSGLYLASHPSAVFDSILCAENEIVLSGQGGWGFGICDTCYVGPVGTTTNVVVMNNVIRYADWTQRPFALGGGLFASDVQHAVFGNNVIAVGANAARLRSYPSGFIPPSLGDCDHFVPDPPPPPTYIPSLDILPAGYRRAWFENRDMSGNLLPISFWKDGVDGLASQQQWSE